MTIGIYIIEFPSGHKYIGQSKNVEARITSHFKDIRDKVHPNRRIRKEVGMPTWRVLEVCSLAELNNKEIFWIEHYNSFLRGLNQNAGGGYRRDTRETTPFPTGETINDSWVGRVIAISFLAAAVGFIINPAVFIACSLVIGFISVMVIINC